jgi:hypothetical protein
MEACLLSCDYVRYSITKKLQTDLTFLEDDCSAAITIAVSSFEYSVYTERFQWTFYTYTSGMGGILGIWLGLDFVCFIEWVLSVANWLLTTAKKLSEKKKKNR